MPKLKVGEVRLKCQNLATLAFSRAFTYFRSLQTPQGLRIFRVNFSIPNFKTVAT